MKKNTRRRCPSVRRRRRPRRNPAPPYARPTAADNETSAPSCDDPCRASTTYEMALTLLPRSRSTTLCRATKSSRRTRLCGKRQAGNRRLPKLPPLPAAATTAAAAVAAVDPRRHHRACLDRRPSRCLPPRQASAGMRRRVVPLARVGIDDTLTTRRRASRLPTGSHHPPSSPCPPLTPSACRPSQAPHPRRSRRLPSPSRPPVAHRGFSAS